LLRLLPCHRAYPRPSELSYQVFPAPLK